jgi:hypothetical protein
MQRGFLIGLGCGLIAGALLVTAGFPPRASAQAPGGTTGLYQIQIAAGLAQPGTSAIWRLNTATGALEFCTFTNLTVSGANHITCQGNSSPR